MNNYKEHFLEYLARFIAEEPTLGAISLPSLRKFMTNEDIFESDEMWNYHTKDNPDLPFTIFDVLVQFSKKVLGDFTDGHDRYFKLKYAQYEWVRITLENIRRHRGFNNGIIYWMYNDCWPASSGWAFVDYYCLPKASFYSFKRCVDGVIASIDKTEGAYEIYLCNDTLDEKYITLKLSYIKDDNAHTLSTHSVFAKAACSEKVLTLPANIIPEDAILICDVNGNGVWDRAFYKNGALHIVPTNDIRVVSKSENSITVTAESYVHAVELEGEYVFKDNYFSLLPGETRTVSFKKAYKAASEDLTVNAYTIYK